MVTVYKILNIGACLLCFITRVGLLVGVDVIGGVVFLLCIASNMYKIRFKDCYVYR